MFHCFALFHSKFPFPKKLREYNGPSSFFPVIMVVIFCAAEDAFYFSVCVG